LSFFPKRSSNCTCAYYPIPGEIVERVRCWRSQGRLDDQLLSPTPSPNIKTQQWLESQKGFLELKIQQISQKKEDKSTSNYIVTLVLLMA